MRRLIDFILNMEGRRWRAVEPVLIDPDEIYK